MSNDPAWSAAGSRNESNRDPGRAFGRNQKERIERFRRATTEPENRGCPRIKTAGDNRIDPRVSAKSAVQKMFVELRRGSLLLVVIFPPN
jgi:hypothetical protein